MKKGLILSSIIILIFVFLYFFVSIIFKNGQIKNHNIFDDKEQAYYINLLKNKDDNEKLKTLRTILDKIKETRTPKYLEKNGLIDINKQILNTVQNLAGIKDENIKKIVWQILECDYNEWKRRRDIAEKYFDNEDPAYRIKAIQTVMRETNPKYLNKLIEILKKDADPGVRDAAWEALIRYKNPEIFEKIKDAYEDITEPVKKLRLALESKNVEELHKLMNDDLGFKIILYNQNESVLRKVLNLKDAYAFFEGKYKYYDCNNPINFTLTKTVDFKIKAIADIDKSGKIYEYFSHTDEITELKMSNAEYVKRTGNPPLYKGKPSMGVEVRWVGNTIVDEKGQRTIFRDTLFNLIKINNNWYLAGMESDSCQKQFIQL